MYYYVKDIPDSCFVCDCCHEKPYDKKYKICSEKFCGIENEDVDTYHESQTKPNWCPLKAIPEKEHGADHYDEYDTGYENGWNSCIDEISK